MIISRKECAYLEVRTKLPVGIENFEEIRTEGFYYVDKTGLIKELLHSWGKVNLFTRPRRFGKSLNMSMLKSFFEFGNNKRLFEGLQIADEKELCEKYMGKFPVISITLKGVDSRSFEGAKAMLRSTIGREALNFYFLLDSDRLTEGDKALYAQLAEVDSGNQRGFSMADEVLENSLLVLSELLCKHYGQKVILLIDEYDVPLDKAQQSGYYDEMLSLIRNLFGQALKTNNSLYFAVLTGCLRIAKESIFTGLNNFSVMSITDVSFDEQFGFSDGEVQNMLEYYGFSEKYSLVKEWYNGYHFGSTDVYCPWDVINYIKILCSDSNAIPKAFWLNTSGNDIIRKFLQVAGPRTRREIESLIEGKSIQKRMNQELTYRDLYKNEENLWSVLFTTGYLTQCKKIDEDIYQLAIPNLEIKKIFIEQVQQWFQEEARKDTPKLDAFCEAFARGDAEAIEEQFNAYLKKTISIRDTGVRKNKKENFYQGILLGLLSHREDWDISSNAESGNGFSDILVEIEDRNIGIVIEVKYPDSSDLDAGCRQALKQIEETEYTARLEEDGMETIIQYGIACYKKKCRVNML